MNLTKNYNMKNIFSITIIGLYWFGIFIVSYFNIFGVELSQAQSSIATTTPSILSNSTKSKVRIIQGSLNLERKRNSKMKIHHPVRKRTE